MVFTCNHFPLPHALASEGGRGGLGHPWVLKISAKKVVFSISRGKKSDFTTLGLPGKILEKSPSDPPGKNSSDAHDHM